MPIINNKSCRSISDVWVNWILIYENIFKAGCIFRDKNFFNDAFYNKKTHSLPS